jgi:hypothetical protein
MQAENNEQHYLLRVCGYPEDGDPNITMTRLNADGGPASNDPYSWGGRTLPTAHAYIIKEWERLSDGDVVDVSFILGESAEPKQSQKFDVF